jgi:hypothetical protein
MVDQPPSSASATVGNQDFTSRGNEANALDFIIRQIMGQVCTMQLAQVTSVTPAGTGSLVAGIVTLQPMVSMIDGSGNATPHGIVNAVPYFRLQGGSAGVVLDPVVGDIGLAIFAMRDISSVKATQKPSNPGSRRQYDWADAVYLGGVLNGELTDFVQFLPGGGINVTSSGDLTVTASGNINLNGTLMINGDAYLSHMHSGVTTGGGDTGGVV